MSLRIGVAIARDTVRAVAVRDGAVIWVAEASRDGGDPLASTLSALVSGAPVRRWSRPVLSAAVGGGASQVRLVTGLPETDDAEMLAEVVRTHAASFFLKNGVPLITSGVRIKAPGRALAAAADAPIVQAVSDVCGDRRWRLGTVAPTPVVLPVAVTGERVVWREGEVISDVTCASGVIESIRTRMATAADTDAAVPEPVATLAAIGEQATSFTAAYGAAMLPASEPLTFHATVRRQWSARDLRRRLVMPASLLGIAVVSILLSPLAASVAGARADARLQAIRDDEWTDVTAALAQLERITASLHDLRGFAASRRTATGLLGDLARALPDGSVIAMIDLREDHGEVHVLTPRPDAVLAAVSAVRDVAGAELGPGSVREAVAGQGPQRVVVRFRLVAEEAGR